MATLGRTYSRRENREVPSEAALKVLVKAEAVRQDPDSLFSWELQQQPLRRSDRVTELEIERRTDAPAADERPGKAPGVSKVSVSGVSPAEEIALPEFTRSGGGYAQRTRENAAADDVDFTVALAVDFSTFGEQCTKKAAGESYIGIDLPVTASGSLDGSDKGVKAVVERLKEMLPDEFIEGEPFGVNIAGNGIYTLASRKITQDELNAFMVKVFAEVASEGMKISSVRSGGQTGIDEAGVLAAQVMGIPATVHAPRQWEMRGANGFDVKNEQSFRNRFALPRVEKLREKMFPGFMPRKAASEKVRRGDSGKKI